MRKAGLFYQRDSVQERESRRGSVTIKLKKNALSREGSPIESGQQEIVCKNAAA